ncbi:MAG: hypothetical protein ACLQU1_44275 [Bryobacteraceae bacterium]
MRILFDHGTPSGIARSLAGHKVTEAIERGWDRISNGELLTTAEAAGFELLLTTDKNIRYQQNLKGRKIAIVVLGNSAWRMVRKHLDRVAAAVDAATPGRCKKVKFRERSPRKTAIYILLKLYLTCATWRITLLHDPVDTPQRIKTAL